MVAAQIIPIKPAQLITTLKLVISNHDPKQPIAVVIHGAPGTGKSQITHAVARSLTAHLTELRGALLDPVDLMGLPLISNGQTVFAPPKMLPTAQTLGILFLDELNRAVAMVQNALMQLVLDRRLGEYLVPDQTVVIAACNRESDGGGVTRMNSALSNRFMHFELEPDLDDWCQWADIADLDPMVVAFLRFRPELFHAFDRNVRAYPTPRSWEFVSRICKMQPSADISLAMYAGCVGYGAALEFAAFERLFRQIPNADAILMTPTSSPVPTESSQLYAVATVIARKATAANFGRAITYLERLPREYAAMGITSALKRDPELALVPEYTRSVLTHKWGA